MKSFTERGLQAQIDKTPDDSDLYLILADHLEEHGDARGPGYRALGRMGLRPLRESFPDLGGPHWSYHDGTGRAWTAAREVALRQSADRPERVFDFDLRNRRVLVAAPPWCELPKYWFNGCWSEDGDPSEVQMCWIVAGSREGVDDMVTAEFTRLPQLQRDFYYTGKQSPAARCRECPPATMTLDSATTATVAASHCRVCWGSTFVAAKHCDGCYARGRVTTLKPKKRRPLLEWFRGTGPGVADSMYDLEEIDCPRCLGEGVVSL